MKKVFIVGRDKDIFDMFVLHGWIVSDDIYDCDLVQFTGGADVTPLLYKENQHPETFCVYKRDKTERIVFNAAKEGKIPMAGICRGGQFLNVMNGGKLYQHVDGHTGVKHKVKEIATGKDWHVTSTHHQMMRPHPSGVVLAHTLPSLCTCKEFMEGEQIVKRYNKNEPDVEVVYYPHSLCLCFQPHPEFHKGETRDFYFSLLKDYLNMEADVCVE